MDKRTVVRLALDHQAPPWVPWSIGLTSEAAEALQHATGRPAHEVLDNHLLGLGAAERFSPAGPDRVIDRWGVTWDRSRDRDIGVIEGRVLAHSGLAGWSPPDPGEATIWAGIEAAIAAQPDRYRVFNIGFSLYERAWTLRGMEELMGDMIEDEAFVDALLDAICDWNIDLVRRAVRLDIDAVYFGDDWGAQRGLQMGPKRWRRFILPRLRRQYAAVRAAGKRVMIHSCGDVDEIFPDLVEAGLSCFNPFQPEVMDVDALMRQWRGRLAFHGGLSTQRLLPHGTPEEVAAETRRLLRAGAGGGYIFSPAHAVEGDVPAANMLAMLEVLRAQPGWPGHGVRAAAAG